MKIQSEFITKFINDLPPKCKTPLDTIITQMLESSKYIDGSTLIYDENNEYDKAHYHNWDCNPKEISQIKNIKNTEYNENNDIELTTLLGNHSSPNIECVKGDVQLGKRLHACIMMWMSIYIYKRPVLYLFRPLNIDKEQLQDDIDGTQPWNFNMEWVKNKFNKSMEYDDSNTTYTDYELPPLTDIKLKNVANKLSDKVTISKHKKIYMALMNPTDLETLNRKFHEYILEYCAKVNITLIIDESDLLSPTAENSNNISEKDTKNSKSERLISRLVNKVAHTIHITGTAHSFFWNFTTALSEEKKTIIPVEKVFVMNRHKNYFGFMKKNITLSPNNEHLPIISEWWSKGRGVSKENKYDVMKDYNLNIKKIINSIVKRQNIYNSFLISEEKIQNNQIKIADKIIKDFHSLFCVVFHGKKGKNGLPTGLRLYFPKKIDNLVIEKELQQVVISEKRLDKYGGLKGTPTSDIDKDYYDDYKYYDIDMKSKMFNIKMVYKVLAMLFKKIKSNKTIITITGKYGERGYSFTSDYYKKDNEYVLHLTDQYFVSHSSYNCTDIFQRGRIQGKYSDKPNLIFWTTKELVKIIDKYVDFLTKIEHKIMSLPRGHYYIRNLCELNLLHKEFIETLGRPRQRKNLRENELYFKYKNNNAMIYSFPPNLEHKKYKEHFSNWCKEQDIEFDGFINRLDTVKKRDFDFKKIPIPGVPIKIELPESILDKISSDKLTDKKRIELLNTISPYLPREIQNKNLRNKRIVNKYDPKYEINNIKEFIKKKHRKRPDKNCKKCGEYNLLIVKNDVAEFESKKGDCFITFYTDEYEKIEENKYINDPFEKTYSQNDNKIVYSKLKYKYINNKFLNNKLEENGELDLKNEDIKKINDNSYLFVTTDGFVYHHDPEKSIKRVKLKIKSEIEVNSEIVNPMLKFFQDCIKKIDGSKRVGIKNVMSNFNTWCKKNNIEECKKLKDFSKLFNDTTGLTMSKSNTRGYKIEINI
jgi:hypothetical protein